jgi:hypothetical protein
MEEYVDVDARKAFAVKVLADAWAGVKMPEELLLEAKRIRTQMLEEGIWESA